MAVIYTTAKLLESIRNAASMPDSQQLYSDARLLVIATEELESYVVPFIMAARQEYFVGYKDFTIPIQSTPYEIDIPSDAIGQKLRDVCWYESSTGSLTSLPKLELEQVSGNSYSQSGFDIRANKIIIYPGSSKTTLRVFYYKRPLELIKTSNAGKVVSVNSGTNEVTLSFLPNDWVIGDEINVISYAQPFHTKVSSRAIVNASSPVLEFDSVDDIAVGDWIALEGYSPIPQIPIEAHRLLAQKVVIKCLEALGDNNGLKAAYADLESKEKSIMKVINPRIDGASTKITTNGNGIFDRRSRNFRCR